MMNKYFSRAAGAGLIVANTIVAVPAGAALNPDTTSLDKARVGKIEVVPPKPDLHTCIVQAVKDNSLFPLKKGEKIDDDGKLRADKRDGSHIRLVSILQSLKDGWLVGPTIGFKTDKTGPGSLVVSYTLTKTLDINGPTDILTQVFMDKDNISNMDIFTSAGKYANQEDMLDIKDRAVHMAEDVIACMNGTPTAKAPSADLK